MRHVLTLVSPQPLDSDRLRTLRADAERILAAIDPTDRLHARAVDLPCEVEDPVATEAKLRIVFLDAEIDFALQASEGRRKQLLVADMESTMIHNEMLDELADLADCQSQVAEITERAMNGELDFHQALGERVALLKGLDEQAFEDVRSRIVLDSGARLLISTLQAHGVRTALVSSGFDVFVEPVAAQLGFDTWQANRLEIADGKLTGHPIPPILDKNSKLEALLRFCSEGGIEPTAACTVGDGANDLLMLQAASLGVAFHGKPRVADAAPFRIDHNDLSALLFYQGYREDELA